MEPEDRRIWGRSTVGDDGKIPGLENEGRREQAQPPLVETEPLVERGA